MVVGSILCGDNTVSFLGLDDVLSASIYKSFTPTNDKSVINDFAFHPNKDLLLCAGTSGIWSIDASTNTKEKYLNFGEASKSSNPSSISCITTNDQWFGWSEQNVTKVFAWNDCSKLVTMKKHTQNINAISFIANRYIVCADINGTILLHNCNSHLLSTKFDAYVNMNGVNCIETTKNRINWFCCSNDNGSNYLFDITREKMIYHNTEHSGPANQCAFNPVYSSLIVSVGLDKKIFVHDINRKQIGIKVTTNSPLSCVQYLPGSEQHIICGGTNGDVYLYDMRKFVEPMQTITTSSCVLGLGIHSSLKFSSIQMNKENIAKLNQNKINKDMMSPITSAVSTLPSMEYMTQRFGNIDIKKEINFDFGENDNKTIDTNDNNKQEVETIKETNVECKEEHDLEGTIRSIVQDEISKSETRVLKEMNSKFEQLHSDLLDQFITNEISAEKNMEKIFALLNEFKQQNDVLRNELKYATF